MYFRKSVDTFLLGFGFFETCIISLIFLGINLLFLSTTFFWYQLKPQFLSTQDLKFSSISLPAILIDLLIRYICQWTFTLTKVHSFTVKAVSFINKATCFLCRIQTWLYGIWVYVVSFISTFHKRKLYIRSNLFNLNIYDFCLFLSSLR